MKRSYIFFPPSSYDPEERRLIIRAFECVGLPGSDRWQRLEDGNNDKACSDGKSSELNSITHN